MPTGPPRDEAKRAPMSTPTGTNLRITGLDLAGYIVKDLPRAVAWYRDVLGLTPAREYPDNGGVEYDFADGATFGLWDPKGMMPWTKGVGVMFAVEDFPAAVRTARERGATFSFEHETPVCFMALTEDSEGNQVMLHKRKPVSG
jgi:predicted enzyme related to lactoylglutathione lyase